ncbi:MAG: DUF695 domain-containing protein [Arcicella sp.]|jgi:uncharacterized protein (TIGR01619 family)|nr:DUF695 domain-containing protein [Arcicella sp.]
MKSICWIFFFILISQKLSAQTTNEIWDNYMATFENKPGSIVVRMDLINLAPLKEYKFILITGITYESKSPDGLPDKETLSAIQKVGDELQQTIAISLKEVYVGSFTYNNERLEYFYLQDTVGAREILKSFYKSKYDKLKTYINIRNDSDWKAYKEFLYPNEETLNYMADSKVVFSLIESGDKLTKARKVDHFSYFKSKKDAEQFKDNIQKVGYRIEKIDKNSDSAYPYSVLFWKEQNVDLNSISQITTVLREISKRCNGEYDGWETMVIKD